MEQEKTFKVVEWQKDGLRFYRWEEQRVRSMLIDLENQSKRYRLDDIANLRRLLPLMRYGDAHFVRSKRSNMIQVLIFRSMEKSRLDRQDPFEKEYAEMIDEQVARAMKAINALAEFYPDLEINREKKDG